MSNQEVQIQELLRNLTSLTSEVELLVEKSKTGNPDHGDGGSPPIPTSDANRDFVKHKTLNSPVRLNVGGKIFTTTWKMLSQQTNTRLGRLSQVVSLEEALIHCDGYNPARNEFFFNRRSRNFGEFLDFYRHGSLHIRKHLFYFLISLNYRREKINDGHHHGLFHK